MNHHYYILLLLVLFVSCSLNNTEQRITPVSFTDVKITDNFWGPRIKTNQKVTIPHSFKMCENTGRIQNFEVAAGLKAGEYQGVYPFNDSDVYKIIEGAAYTFQTYPDPVLESYVDSLIYIIAAAQEDDGYLMTWRTINPNKPPSRWSGAAERWSDVSQGHELYCAGHLYEAAVAYFQASGKRKLLDVAIKNADLIVNEFGPGKIEEPPGHQEIELGLVKLYKVTGESLYLDLADFFLKQRGHKKYDPSSTDMWQNGSYCQDHKPVCEQTEAVGHAVRAAYMYSAMADVAMLTSDDTYQGPLDQLWENVVDKKMHITGGLGSVAYGEAFGPEYDLPNLSAYDETCASVANVFWNHRMFQLNGNAEHIDVMERTMYNALLAGISLDGTQFFYPNVLQSKGHDQRSSWFRCACCPGNITRFMASLPGYIYATAPAVAYINLFVDNDAELIVDKTRIGISQKTNYPWEGDINISLNPDAPKYFTLNIRIPGWAQNEPVPGDLYKYLKKESHRILITINGEDADYTMVNGYASFLREWKKDDLISVKLPMPVRKIVTNEEVETNINKVALQRGPVVFCAESVDNNQGKITNLVLNDTTSFHSEFHPELLNGIQMISGQVKALAYDLDNQNLIESVQDIKLIPYYAWAHRGKGAMSVWLADEASAAEPVNSPPISMNVIMNYSAGENPNALNDQVSPSKPGNVKPDYFTWSADTSGIYWVEYNFPNRVELSAVGVSWVSDQKCQIPDSWKVVYKSNDKWVRIFTEQEYGTKPGEFNLVEFETVRTRAIRLEATANNDKSLGLFEWTVE